MTKQLILKVIYCGECIRNKVTSMIRDAKKDYFEYLSSEYKNDTRKYWKELRCRIGDKRNDSQVSFFLDSNIFNTYFANIGNKVAKIYS